MDLIIKDRGHGKTYELVKRSAETGYRIITPYPQSSRRIQDIANNLGLTIPQPLEYRHLNFPQYQNFKEPVLVDELDTFIRQALGYKVVVATLPSENTRVLEESEHFLVPRPNVGNVRSGYGRSEKLIHDDITEPNKAIKDVIFNNPATIVYWHDGSKTVVKCQDGDTYSEELGLAMCIIKKLCSNRGGYNDVFKKWLPNGSE